MRTRKKRKNQNPQTTTKQIRKAILLQKRRVMEVRISNGN
jgi:hypothetical protein|nr:MAG TPA: hypothetical protein [Caudoviricetes sp.]